MFVESGGYAFPSGVNISSTLIWLDDDAVEMKENIHAEERWTQVLLRLIDGLTVVWKMFGEADR